MATQNVHIYVLWNGQCVFKIVFYYIKHDKTVKKKCGEVILEKVISLDQIYPR